MIRTYKIAYDTPSISGRSLITTIQQCDSQIGRGTCMPPTTFTWEPGKLEFKDVPFRSMARFAQSTRHQWGSTTTF